MFRLKSINVLKDCRIDSKSEAKRKKMREKLKELGNMMTNLRIVNIDFIDICNAIAIIFNNGVISYVYFNGCNYHSIVNIRHDKYLLNKLLSEHVVNVELRDQFILVSYTQPKLTYVSMSASTDAKRQYKPKIASRNPQLITIELENSTTRRAERKLVVNDSGDQLIVWWKTGTNTVAPWSAPGRRLREMANIFVYRFGKHIFELITCSCITGDIFEITFMKWNPSQVVLLQQSTDSSYVLNYCILEMNESFECLQQIYSIRIPLLRPCLSAQFTSAQDKIVLLCDDDSITLFNIEQNALYSLHSSVKAFDFACNQMDAIFTVADQFGRVSLYDYALNTLSINYDQLFNDEICHLRHIKFITPTMLCLLFNEEKSKIVLITLPDIIDNKTLITEYVKREKISEAIAALQTINWNCYCDIAYFCLNTIFNHLINDRLSHVKEAQLEKTLATFFTPSIPIDDELCEIFKLEMHYLAKRFFYHLLRYNCLEKAFLLGVDLKSKHLFILLYKIANERGNTVVAEAALLKSEQYTRKEASDEHSYYIDQSIISANGYSSRERNNNDEDVVTMKESLPVSSSLNTVGLPSTKSTNSTQSDYKDYRQSHYETNANAMSKPSHNMPIASILKPSSSKLASNVNTKPVTFISPESNVDSNETLYTLSTKRKLPTSLPNGYFPLVSKNKFSHKTKVCIENENNDTIVHSLMPNGFNRSSISSSSSSSSNPSKTSSCSSSSYTSASLSLHTPPIILESDQLSHDLKNLQLKAIQFAEPPPDLPPRTYLMKQYCKPPERPPKKLIIVENNNLKATHLNEHLMNNNTTSVPFNLPELKSSSKIECIHFGVV